jgi:hypothetical protein
MDKVQEQIIKDALNIAIEILTDGEEGHRDERLKTVDNAWDILFNKEDDKCE